MIKMKPFKLMNTLFAHTGDVKSLCKTKEKGGFVSVSRDLSAKVWRSSDDKNSNQYVLERTIDVHKKYVNAVCVAYSVPDYPLGLIITGSNDQTIAIHSIGSNELVAQLHEHQGAVCTLYIDKAEHKATNLLYSGSFDCSVKVWDLNKLVEQNSELKSSFTLQGHEQTVWSVAAIDNLGVILTASADKTIKHWQLNNSRTNADCVQKYVGHTDCVRGLALSHLNDKEFFSCSNDGSVIQWRLNQSTPVRTIKITDSFLYSINMLELNDQPECYFITSGEDRSLRVHSVSSNQSNLVQTLALPCQTLWYTTGLNNGNIAVACCDGSIRLFTQDTNLMANPKEQEEYESELARFTIPLKANESMSQINRTDLPGIEALSIPGKRDGQTLMLNNENQIEVYQWDSAETKWVKIGVAVGSSDAAGGTGHQKVTHLGKEYDFVFDIELDDAGNKLKLPYNLSEDPYHAAQAFIHRHELNQLFLDQIAHFIIKNTQSETIGTAGVSSNTSDTYYDPFTGAGRYVPQSNGSGVTSPSRSMASDPFTGSNAYHTGLNNSRASAPSAPPEINIKRLNDKNSNEFYPHNDFILFDQTNSELVIKKLKEFQQQLATTSSNDLITNLNNIELIEHLLSNFNNLKSHGQFNDQIDLLFQMIEAWPIENVFPLVDLARILVLNKDFAEYLCRDQNISYLTLKQAQPNTNRYFDILFKLINQKNLTCTMLVVRVMCNLFNTLNIKPNQKVLAFLLNERLFIMQKLSAFVNTENKGLQIAYSTLFLNYVVLFNKLYALDKEKFSSDFINDMFKELIEHLNDQNFCDHLMNWDAESIFRFIVSYGTMVSNQNKHLDHEYLLSISRSLENFRAICEKLNSNSAKYPEKVKLSLRYLLDCI